MLAMCLVAFQASAATYRVNPTGSDNNDGIVSPVKTVQRALILATTGDTVTVDAGSYAGPVKVVKSGTILKASDPTNKPKISCPTTDPAQQSTLEIGLDAANVTLLNLDISGGYYYGIKSGSNWDDGEQYKPYHGTQNLTVDGCLIHDTGTDAVKLTPGAKATIRDCTITGSGKRDSANAQGVDMVNGLLTMQRTTIAGCPQGAYLKGGSTFTVEQCLFKDIAQHALSCGQDTDYPWFDPVANPQLFECVGCTVRNCLFLRCGGSGVQVQAAKGLTVAGCTLVDCSSSVIAGGSITILGVEHYLPPGFNVATNRSSEDITITDNIVLVTKATPRPIIAIRAYGGGMGSGLKLGRNLYFNALKPADFTNEMLGQAGVTFSAWKVGYPDASIVGDPKLDLTTYKPLAGSPAIGAGESWPGLGLTTDYYAKARPSPPSIGAAEGDAVTPPPPPPVQGLKVTGVKLDGTPFEVVGVKSVVIQ